MEDASSVRRFWFGDDPDDAAVAQERASLWWSKSPETDAEIRERFQPLVGAAARGELDAWRSRPEGRLSLILLTDQLPRNIFRDTPEAFASDPVARALCSEGLAAGDDRQLRAIERVFFYLPLEHSEDLEDQRRSVRLFRELAEEVRPEWRKAFEGFLDFAVRHHDIVERFGRFPHRNTILGRTPTREELEFLEQPGSSF